MVQPAGAQMEEEWVEEGGGEQEGGDDAARALHARLVALAARGEPEGRGGVWSEHSYARAKSGAGAVRELLARAPSPARDLDVEAPRAAPPAPAAAAADCEPEWEARVLAAAPSAAHGRLARAALGALAALRLARLAGAGVSSANVRRDEARAAARRVRRALAGMWARAGGGGGEAAGWLHGALGASALWREVAGELRRAVPRLAARLHPAPALPPPDPLDRIGSAVGGEGAGPWLAWVRCAGDGGARWPRRLRALLHVREVSAPPAPAAPAAPAAPDAWCAAAAVSARAQLQDIIAEAGSRAVIVGGAGAGASLALCAWGGLEGARGLVLLAPALLTAEGAAPAPAGRALVVAGGAGAAGARGAACALAGAGAGRRVLVVRGADDALRLPARRRRRRQLPQQALDAAVAEEIARWAQAAAEGEPAPRRLPHDLTASDEDEDSRAIHIARGLIREFEPSNDGARVSRVAGGTPLALAPPRRRAPSPPPAPPAAPAPAPLHEPLDIMQLPIVFADDEPPAPSAPPAPPSPPPVPALHHKRSAPATAVTVTSGLPRGGRALNYTRVIVAKRRGAGGAGGVAGVAGGAGRGAGGARPVVLRRTLRLMPRGRARGRHAPPPPPPPS